jgi:probable HAF family extracellular repeat protein
MKKTWVTIFCFFLLLSVFSSIAFSAYFRGIGTLTGDLESEAWGISPNGSAVVGASLSDTLLPEAFRWTEPEGMVGLGFLPGHTKVKLGEHPKMVQL